MRCLVCFRIARRGGVLLGEQLGRRRPRGPRTGHHDHRRCDLPPRPRRPLLPRRRAAGGLVQERRVFGRAGDPGRGRIPRRPATGWTRWCGAPPDLRPFVRDEGLTRAAQACAAFRARAGLFGHTADDFTFVPAGSSASTAGCAGRRLRVDELLYLRQRPRTRARVGGPAPDLPKTVHAPVRFDGERSRRAPATRRCITSRWLPPVATSRCTPRQATRPCPGGVCATRRRADTAAGTSLIRRDTPVGPRVAPADAGGVEAVARTRRGFHFFGPFFFAAGRLGRKTTRSRRTPRRSSFPRASRGRPVRRASPRAATAARGCPRTR